MDFRRPINEVPQAAWRYCGSWRICQKAVYITVWQPGKTGVSYLQGDGWHNLIKGPELVLPARMQVASEARGETQTSAKPVQLRLPAPLSHVQRDMEKGSFNKIVRLLSCGPWTGSAALWRGSSEGEREDSMTSTVAGSSPATANLNQSVNYLNKEVTNVRDYGMRF